jgi:predicted glycosyltransferase
MQNQKKTVLVAPLNWGLGHATRCIPIIHELLKQNADVIICAEGMGKKLLQQEFPTLKFISIPAHRIRYSEFSMVLSMLLQLPLIILSIRKENKKLQELLHNYNISHVISDNRYGLYAEQIKCAFITHQVNIQTPGILKFLQPVLYFINCFFIKKFNELWIPDTANLPSLSGKLSDASKLQHPVKHVGILSRFSKPCYNENKEYDIIALLSGPEPQRTMLEQKLARELEACGKKYLIIRGKIGEEKETGKHLLNEITAEQLQAILHPSTLLVARPGYSTLMDTVMLKHARFLFIPTPGQTEQLYLASYLHATFGCPFIHQHQQFYFHEKVSPLDINPPDFLLATAVNSFLISD